MNKKREKENPHFIILPTRHKILQKEVRIYTSPEKYIKIWLHCDYLMLRVVQKADRNSKTNKYNRKTSLSSRKRKQRRKWLFFLGWNSSNSPVMLQRKLRIRIGETADKSCEREKIKKHLTTSLDWSSTTMPLKLKACANKSNSWGERGTRYLEQGFQQKKKLKKIHQSSSNRNQAEIKWNSITRLYGLPRIAGDRCGASDNAQWGLGAAFELPLPVLLARASSPAWEPASLAEWEAKPGKLTCMSLKTHTCTRIYKFSRKKKWFHKCQQSYVFL